MRVVHIDNPQELQMAFDIREKVYIIEQQIERAEEFDEFDSSAYHFLAYSSDKPAGTCRYRKTKNGIKLERFATLPELRGKGVASALMEAMLEHIEINHPSEKKLYLNAQLTAIPLYTKFGFQPDGAVFMECEIEHQQMIKLVI